ncbi:MAG: hypothetical protein RIR00_1006 [Pseudomonadota bacterium]|jgi:hypothetical protein
MDANSAGQVGAIVSDLSGAIKHATEVAEREGCTECGQQHRQLAAWLKELRDAKTLYQEFVGCECPECGSTDTEWHCSQTTNSGVVDGRLRMHDVSTVFYLGCNCCSETIRTRSGDDIARLMTEMANAAMRRGVEFEVAK